MSIWEKYPFSGATAVLFNHAKESEGSRSRLRITPDPGLVNQRLGVRIVGRPLRNLRASPHSTREAERLVSKWKGEARSISSLSDDALHDAARYFPLFRDILHKENAVAMAVDCQRMPHIALPFPCLAMFELYRSGIVTACEADVNAMLSMMLLTHLSGKPSFMGNTFPEGSNSVAIDHCVTPTGMADGFDGYRLADRHGDSSCATAAVDLPPEGPATIARISEDLAALHVAVGEVVASHHRGNCRNTLIIRLPHRDVFAEGMVGRHYSVVCSDLSDGLAAWAADVDLNLVLAND